MKVVALAVGTLLVVAACGGGSGSRVADPFRHGVAGARVVADAVICEPTPTMCTRYVVLAPLVGTTQQGVFRAAETVVKRDLGWAENPAPPIPNGEGTSFDGKPGQGGFITSVSDELALAHGDLDSGASAKTGVRLIAAMRGNPSGMIVRIMNNR